MCATQPVACGHRKLGRNRAARYHRFVKDRRKLSETVARYLRMLQLVPRGRKIDAGTIERLLGEQGFEIHRRSVQRDLEVLSLSFPGLSCDRASKPYGWSWDRDAPLLDIPSMSVSTAMTLELVRSFILQTLPRSTMKSLQAHFERARETLENSGGRLASWPRKVRVIPRGQPLVPPTVSETVLDVVYAALLEGKRFATRYRKRGARQDQDYEVSPLGLVVRNGVLMLVCRMGEGSEIKHMVLHRMTSATPLDKAASTPAGFSLQQHIEQGGVAFGYGSSVKLRLLLRADAAITLRETPLSADQNISPAKGGDELVCATVPDTLELRAWIASYGGLAEVLGPPELRKHMAGVAKEMAERYAKGAGKAKGWSRA
jgi:predicted DNA-binding transcriptional regulator YafY